MSVPRGRLLHAAAAITTGWTGVGLIFSGTLVPGFIVLMVASFLFITLGMRRFRAKRTGTREP